MSNNVIQLTVAKAFAHLDASKGLAEGISGGFSSIGYRGKVLTLRHRGQTYPFKREDDGTALSYIDLIIVGVNPTVSKAYYTEWDDDAGGPPVCASLMGEMNGPDPGVAEPQATSCMVCKHNVWRTLPNGRKGKGCQDYKRLAVLLMPKMTAKMLGSPLTEPVFLKIPPGSLTALKTYSESLQHRNLPWASVITRISFHQQELFQFEFEAIKALTDREAPWVFDKMDNPLTNRIIGVTPDIQEVTDEPKRPIPKPKPQPLEETGLEEASAALIEHAVPEQAVVPLPKRAKAPKAAPLANVEIETDEAEEADEVDAAPPPPPPKKKKGVAAKPAQQWGDASSELDHTINDLMNRAIEGMMK